MISYRDPDYLRTKAIKRGDTQLPGRFVALANWIAGQFDCEAPLNIEYEWCELARSNRLQVVFEHAGVDRLFYDAVGNFDSPKQAMVASQFRALAAAEGRNLDSFFVVFTSFEQVARWEANAATEQNLPLIERSIGDPRVWTIRPQFETATVLLQSDEQLEHFDDQDRRSCQTAYMTELLPHDEFGYFQARPIDLFFDSKERFEREFEGNWFLYDR